MATSQKAFDQVKSILGKLDRNIDQTRQRRLGDPAPRLPVAPVHNTSPVIGPSLNTTIGTGTSTGLHGNTNGNGNGHSLPGPIPAALPPVSKSGYGRAQPLRPEARSA
jgi:hypothetical protein